MNKSEMIFAIANKAQVTKRDAGAALDAIGEILAETLSKDDKVKIAGIGTFERTVSNDRVGRNPRTGEEMTIPGHGRVHFAPAKELRDAVK